MFQVDWKLLDGWEGEFVDPVWHEGVEYRRATVERLHQPYLWRLILRPAGWYATGQLMEAHETESCLVEEGQFGVEWRTALVMNVDEFWLSEPGRMFKKLPRYRDMFERLAAGINEGLADAERVKRRKDGGGGCTASTAR